ncbi:MAG: WG repeat-containing protein [Muribaculaceae bacterium]|nr:WG repeat-containing protein [Muribaculaceae bacterium]
MAEFTMNGRTKVKTLKANFKKEFGCTLRVYKSVSCKGGFADEEATLASIRAEGAKGGELVVRGNMHVGNFEKKVAELYGIGVQVANPDDSALSDNSISISAAGMVNNLSKEDKLKKYDNVFQDGDIYSVSLNDRWGFLDKNGDELISPKYDWLGDEFVEGMIIVCGEGGIGFVNDKGKEVIKPTYKTAQDFHNGKAQVSNGKETFYIDKKGNIVVDTLKNEKKINHVVVEIEITEHDYAAFDSNDEMLGESFVFNSDESPDFIRITVDGKEIDLNDVDIDGDYSDYQKFDMAQQWNNDDIVKFGYYDNIAGKTWEFDVENFDIEKLSFYYECFDVNFAPADYDCEEHRISLRYDGKKIEEDLNAYDCSDGDFEQEWYLYDDDE